MYFLRRLAQLAIRGPTDGLLTRSPHGTCLVHAVCGKAMFQERGRGGGSDTSRPIQTAEPETGLRHIYGRSPPEWKMTPYHLFLKSSHFLIIFFFFSFSFFMFCLNAVKHLP